MSNYNIKINFSKIDQSFVASIKGRSETKKCLCIPLDAKGVFVGEKGIYMDFSAMERKNPMYNQTHFIKIPIPKEEYQQLTTEERDNIPIVGHMEPIKRTEIKNTEVITAPEVAIEQDDEMSYDDLPF